MIQCNNLYSTAGIDGEKSVEAWRQAMAEVYYRLDIRPTRADRLRGELVDWQSGTLGVSNFRADAQRVIRRKEGAKADKAEDLVFLFPTRHAMRFEQRGREGLVMPGSVFLLNAAEAYVIDVPDASENITIKIDRERLAPRAVGVDDLCATADFTNPLLVPAITTLGEQILKMQPSEHSVRIEDCIIDMLCLMIECRDQRKTAVMIRETLGTSLFSRISAYIRRNLADHSLTPERTATDHRISVRYLHKIFQYRGTTFGQVLHEARLQQAHLIILASSPKGTPNLGEVAFRCGFVSQSHFSASYKKRFGIPPRKTVSS
jgi:AraC-like DNA-binding protein